jgi:hypothetical protein
MLAVHFTMVADTTRMRQEAISQRRMAEQATVRKGGQARHIKRLRIAAVVDIKAAAHHTAAGIKAAANTSRSWLKQPSVGPKGGEAKQLRRFASGPERNRAALARRLINRSGFIVTI